MKQARSKRGALLKTLIEQRERLEREAYNIQCTVDVREAGNVLAAYAVIIRWLDRQIIRMEFRK